MYLHEPCSLQTRSHPESTKTVARTHQCADARPRRHVPRLHSKQAGEVFMSEPVLRVNLGSRTPAVTGHSQACARQRDRRLARNPAEHGCARLEQNGSARARRHTRLREGNLLLEHCLCLALLTAAPRQRTVLAPARDLRTSPVSCPYRLE